MEHTKGKWTVEKTIIQNESGYPIAQVWPNVKMSSSKSIDLMKANAEFIVRACNSHDKLVEACRETEEALIRFRAVNGKEYPDWQSLDWNFPARLTQIQAALAEGD